MNTPTKPFRSVLRAPSFAGIFLFLIQAALHAGSATWNFNPTDGDWNTAANWTPQTVPNGPDDTATFALSDTTDVSLASDTQVNGIVFTPGASSFTITTKPAAFSFTGTGIENDSGVTQNFVANQLFINLAFYNQATAGDQTVFTLENLGGMLFYNEATAGSGTFFTKGNSDFMDGASIVAFYDDSSAANGTFINGGGTGSHAEGGSTLFSDDSTAANGTFTNAPSTDAFAYQSATSFRDNSTAADSMITNEGGIVSDGVGGMTQFVGNTTAGNATIISEGAQVIGAFSGHVSFLETAGAGTATLVAKGGINNRADGGQILFEGASDGAQARVQLLGNGELDLFGLTNPGLTIGSLEGDGIVVLFGYSLTIGSNNLSTKFSGVIRAGGPIIKIGSGTLTLSGANIYARGTTLSEGFLRVDNKTGSGTGTGAAQVNGGVLGGGGIMSGNVTVGSGNGPGATIAPGTGANTLTTQGTLTFNADGSYLWRVRAKGPNSDKLVANGVTIEGGAQITGLGRGTLTAGTMFTAINNTAATPIAGTFGNLPDGGTLQIGNNTYQANYEGGDGNDLTLTVVQ